MTESITSNRSGRLRHSVTSRFDLLSRCILSRCANPVVISRQCRARDPAAMLACHSVCKRGAGLRFAARSQKHARPKCADIPFFLVRCMMARDSDSHTSSLTTDTATRRSIWVTGRATPRMTDVSALRVCVAILRFIVHSTCLRPDPARQENSSGKRPKRE